MKEKYLAKKAISELNTPVLTLAAAKKLLKDA